MLRKTLVTLTAIVALAAGSTAMAAHGGGGGGHGGGFGGGGGFAGAHGFGGGGGFAGGGWHGGGPGPMVMRGGSVGPVTRGGLMKTAPVTGGRVQGWNGRTAWGRDHFHDHFHHRFHNRNFFAFGFGGPYYDYAYDSCWTQVPTYYGWQWVNVCSDYGYY